MLDADLRDYQSLEETLGKLSRNPYRERERFAMRWDNGKRSRLNLEYYSSVLVFRISLPYCFPVLAFPY